MPNNIIPTRRERLENEIRSIQHRVRHDFNLTATDLSYCNDTLSHLQHELDSLIENIPITMRTNSVRIERINEARRELAILIESQAALVRPTARLQQSYAEAILNQRAIIARLELDNSNEEQPINDTSPASPGDIESQYIPLSYEMNYEPQLPDSSGPHNRRNFSTRVRHQPEERGQYPIPHSALEHARNYGALDDDITTVNRPSCPITPVIFDAQKCELQVKTTPRVISIVIATERHTYAKTLITLHADTYGLVMRREIITDIHRRTQQPTFGLKLALVEDRHAKILEIKGSE